METPLNRDELRKLHRASDNRPYLCQTCHHSYHPCDVLRLLNEDDKTIARLTEERNVAQQQAEELFRRSLS